MFLCRLRSTEVCYWVCNQPHSFDPVTGPGERRFTFILQLLSGEEFLKRIIELVEPLGDVQYPEQGVSSVMRENTSSLIGFMSRVDGIADLTANVITVAGAVSSSLVLPALGTMIEIMAFQFIRNMYQKG